MPPTWGLGRPSPPLPEDWEEELDARVLIGLWARLGRGGPGPMGALTAKGPGGCAGADGAGPVGVCPQGDFGRGGAGTSAAAELLVGSALHGPLHLPAGGHPAGGRPGPVSGARQGGGEGARGQVRVARARPSPTSRPPGPPLCSGGLPSRGWESLSRELSPGHVAGLQQTGWVNSQILILMEGLLPV